MIKGVVYGIFNLLCIKVIVGVRCILWCMKMVLCKCGVG